MSNWHQVVWLILDGSLKILICFNPYPLNPKAAIPGSVSLCWANQHSWLSSTFLPFSEAQLSHSSSSKNESKRMPGFTAGSHWHSNNSSSLLLIPRPPHTFEYLGVFLYDHFSECEKQYCTVSPNDKKKKWSALFRRHCTISTFTHTKSELSLLSHWVHRTLTCTKPEKFRFQALNTSIQQHNYFTIH